MRPYIPSSKVGDIKNELPHYYCNLHNPDPDSYPTEPGKEVTIVKEPPALPPDEEEPDDSSGDDSGDSDNGSDNNGNNGSGNGGEGSGNGENGSEQTPVLPSA